MSEPRQIIKKKLENLRKEYLKTREKANLKISVYPENNDAMEPIIFGRYILMKNHTEESMEEFIAMVFESDVIVCLSQLNESERYYDDDACKIIGNFSVHVKVKIIEKDNPIVQRTLEITRNDVSKTVTQIQYLGWGDTRTCNNILDIVKILEMVDRLPSTSQKVDRLPSTSQKIVIHCDTGIVKTRIFYVAHRVVNIAREIMSGKNETPQDPNLNVLTHDYFIGTAISVAISTDLESLNSLAINTDLELLNCFEICIAGLKALLLKPSGPVGLEMTRN